MKRLAIFAATSLMLTAAAATAQTGQVRVEPGFFCALNKCVRFSDDLSKVSIQGRVPVSVEDYNLRANPVISAAAFSEIFYLALRQSSVNGLR